MTWVKYQTTDELFDAVREELARPGYAKEYANEQAFEREVWTRLRALVDAGLGEPEKRCLTSHTWADGRSVDEWRAFCAEACGADVNVLGSNNRLDVVLKHPDGGSIGVEIKCLGATGHTRKLTQGIGQAILALANRTHTLLAIHCGTVDAGERNRLREIVTRASASSKVAIVVVP